MCLKYFAGYLRFIKLPYPLCEICIGLVGTRNLRSNDFGFGTYRRTSFQGQALFNWAFFQCPLKCPI